VQSLEEFLAAGFVETHGSWTLDYFNQSTLSKLLNDCGFRVRISRAHWQTLEMAYVLKRASAYHSAFGTLKVLVERVGLGRVPMTYYLGQKMVVAEKL